MLTIFSTPKPFRNHIGVIQTNAIQSWVLLSPQCEVILFGNEEGTDKIVAQFGIRHIPEAECNEYGTPLVSDMFKIAQDIASYPLMCYVNADIILMSDFLPAICQVKGQPFLISGQRWDVDLKEPIDFDKPDWETYLRAHVAKYGKLHPRTGLDYFVFPRGMYRDIPPFAIGRPAWDNWVIYKARSLAVPVIDATKMVTVIHQNHGYSHVQMGKVGTWEGPEAERNRALAGGSEHSFNLNHATLLLTHHGLKRGLTIKHLYFRLESMSVLAPHLRFLGIPKKILIVLSKTIRSMLGIAKN